MSPEGRILVDKADRIVRLCSEAMVALKDLDTADIGTLFLGASQTTGGVAVLETRHRGPAC